MQAIGVDVWDGSVAAVASYAHGGGRNITYPLGMMGGGVKAQWNVDRSSMAVVDTLGYVQYITSNSVSYTARYSRSEADIIATLQRLTTSVEQVEGEVPGNFTLAQSYPNPFNEEATIYFGVPIQAVNAHVQVGIYNLLGHPVRMLVNNHLASGQFRVKWNGRNETEQPMPNGIYFCKLQTDSFVATRRMVLMR